MQGGDRVHCLPRRRLVTPSGSVDWLQREASNRSDWTKALADKVQRRLAAGSHLGAETVEAPTSANSEGRTMIISGGAGAQLPPQAMEQALQTKQQFDLHGLHFDSDMATFQPESKST